MSRRRPPPPKPPRHDDPNHYRFIFDRVVAAPFANLDRLFGLTKWVAATALAIALIALGQGYSNHNLPTYLNYVYAVCALGAVLVVTEAVRNLHQFQTKIVFAVVYVSVIVGSAVVIGLVFWQVKVDWGLTQEQLKQRREDEKREQDRKKKEVDDTAARKAEEEARKAERIKCENDRKRGIVQTEKQKTDAHAALVACTETFERQRKPGETFDQFCWKEWNASTTADRAHRAASGKRCDIPAPK